MRTVLWWFHPDITKTVDCALKKKEANYLSMFPPSLTGGGDGFSLRHKYIGGKGSMNHSLPFLSGDSLYVSILLLRPGSVHCASAS